VSSQADISHQIEDVPSASDMRFGIVVAEWNAEITEAMYTAAVDTLKKYGADGENILKHYVPGSFELPQAAQFLADSNKVDAVICLGCIIQGETRHFDFIAESVANGIQNVGMKFNMPVIFGVLTPNNLDQAKDRAGGKHGNKGEDAAIAAIKMTHLKRTIGSYN